jgi:hypothetical protein
VIKMVSVVACDIFQR